MPGFPIKPTLAILTFLGILAFCVVDERHALDFGLSLLMLEARHQTS